MEHSDLLSHSVCICKDSFNISLLFLFLFLPDSWQARQTLINRNSHFSLSLKDYEAAKQLPCPWSGWVWQQWPRPEPDVWRGWADRTQSSPTLPGTSALQSQGMPPQRHWTHSCTTTSSPCKQHIVLGKGRKHWFSKTNSTFFSQDSSKQLLDTKTTYRNQKQIRTQVLHLIFHCLTLILQLAPWKRLLPPPPPPNCSNK